MTAAVLRLKVTLNDLKPDPRASPEGYTSPWRRLFERAAVLEIGRNARRPECVVADLGLNAG